MGSALVAISADDPAIGALQVRWLLLALPGIGQGRAAEVMTELDISPGRRLRGLGVRQRAALLSWLTAFEARARRRSAGGARSGTRATPMAPLVVVSGPSGVGKSTVVRAALEQHPNAWLSVSVTTRPPRAGETDGREYRFVSPAAFDDLVATGALLEWAEYAGNRYGTPRQPVFEQRARGVPVLLEIEVHGARQVRASAPDATLIFIAPPSEEILVARLAGRGTEDRQAMDRRLAIAREELHAQVEFDVVLVNADVQHTAAALVGFLT